MTTVLNIQLNDLSSQFIQNLKQKFGKTTEVEIRLQDKTLPNTLLSEADFWKIINSIDWSKKSSKDKLHPVVQMLAAMPISSIYIFADKLSEKLYNLDTKKHAYAYAADEPDNFISVDDFLYARCAVVAEGQSYYEKVLNAPYLMPNDIVFEPLLNVADAAYELKIGGEFNYRPIYNYETHSNTSSWH
jgi:hypothetical protein